VSIRSDKGHRNRKNSASAEFFRNQRKEQNAARPKQELITRVTHDEKGEAVVTHLRVRD